LTRTQARLHRDNQPQRQDAHPADIADGCQKLTLRSLAPETVDQEIWGILLAHNLVRLEMAEVAAEAEVPPTQLSFTTALHYLRHEWGWMAIKAPGKLPAHLRRLRNRLGELLNTRKRGRTCPRVVKKPPKKYDHRTVAALK
jgi:hypothetical protein